MSTHHHVTQGPVMLLETLFFFGLHKNLIKNLVGRFSAKKNTSLTPTVESKHFQQTHVCFSQFYKRSEVTPFCFVVWQNSGHIKFCFSIHQQMISLLHSGWEYSARKFLSEEPSSSLLTDSGNHASPVPRQQQTISDQQDLNDWAKPNISPKSKPKYSETAKSIAIKTKQNVLLILLCTFFCGLFASWG